MILSAALLLRHGLGRETEARCRRIGRGPGPGGGLRTTDLGGTATTAEATEAVLKELT